MIKRNLLALMLAVLATVAGCTRNGTEQVEPDKPQQEYKAFRLNVLPSFIQTRAVEPMPDYSTFRLYIYEYDPSGANPVTSNYVDDIPMVVITEDGFKKAVRCTTDEEGNFIAFDRGNDIVLRSGTYTFYTVSPAKVADQVGVQLPPAYWVHHGDTGLMTTPTPESVEITPQSPEIGVGSDSIGLFNLKLKPFRRLTTRLTFKLMKGDKVNTLEVDPRGMNISQLNYDSYYYNFYLGDQELRQLPVGGGNPEPGSLNITKWTESTETVGGVETPYWLFETEIIPFDIANNEKRNIELRFHLRVNGDNYKVYFTPIDEAQYERGKSYNYTINVSVGGLFITGWDEGGWNTVIQN